MFEARACQEGKTDGQADASLGRPRKPRPSLTLSLISKRYRDAYLVHYKRAYEHQQRIEERAQAEQLAKTARLLSAQELPKDKRFEQGWRDGFSGKDTPPAQITHEELRAYERGHRLGARHRDYERAKELREMTQSQQRANLQDHSR